MDVDRETEKFTNEHGIIEYVHWNFLEGKQLRVEGLKLENEHLYSYHINERDFFSFWNIRSRTIQGKRL